jgi:hypothetical protein
MAWTAEIRAKAQETKARKKREAVEALAVRAAAPEEPAPEVMPALGDAPQVVEIEDEVAVSEPPAVGMPSPFERFLAEIDDETRELLTEEDGSIPQLEAIWAARVKAAKEARREVAKKQATARADRMAKTDAGLVSPEDAASAALQRMLARKVTWKVEMMRDSKGNLLDEGYRIDGELLYHGQMVTRTYGQWLSYREQWWRAKQHELDFQGRGQVDELRRVSTGALDVKFNPNGARA